MSLEFPVLFIILLLGFHPIAFSDPDPVQDYCILDVKPGAKRSGRFATFLCKNSSETTVDDFIFTGIKYPGNFSTTGFSGVSVNPTTFPGLNTLGMSFVRADVDVGGVNVPHFHPRATEIAFVLEGMVYSGFVDSTNRVLAKVIGKGEVMVFPKGLLHFQMNVGATPATIFGSFNSQNPGMEKIPFAIFGSGIKGELLEKAFGLTVKEIEALKKKFSPKGLR